jgi:hypothetical protein
MDSFDCHESGRIGACRLPPSEVHACSQTIASPDYRRACAAAPRKLALPPWVSVLLPVTLEQEIRSAEAG